MLTNNKNNENNKTMEFSSFHKKFNFKKANEKGHVRFFFREITPRHIFIHITYTYAGLMTLVEVIGDTSSRNCTNRSARTFDNVDNMTRLFDKGRFTILFIIIMLTTS